MSIGQVFLFLESVELWQGYILYISIIPTVRSIFLPPYIHLDLDFLSLFCTILSFFTCPFFPAPPLLIFPPIILYTPWIWQIFIRRFCGKAYSHMNPSLLKFRQFYVGCSPGMRLGDYGHGCAILDKMLLFCCSERSKYSNVTFCYRYQLFFHSCFKSHRTTCRLEILIRENLNNAEGWAVHLQTHIILIEPKKEFDISLNFNYRAPLDIEYWRSSVYKVITINVHWLPLSAN